MKDVYKQDYGKKNKIKNRYINKYMYSCGGKTFAYVFVSIILKEMAEAKCITLKAFNFC